MPYLVFLVANSRLLKYPLRMNRERFYQKVLTIDNFKSVSLKELQRPGKPRKGTPARELAELIIEVYYSPKGYAIMIHSMVPIHIWDKEEHNAINGVSKASPDGDVSEKIFSGELSAMRFISGRLKRLGWESVGRWTKQEEEGE